ncbi:glycosyl transferase [Microbacterium sp. zg-Y818]|uniref:glycosyl transferase n=1 Tax=unclassified Microbacterium TaxID=2609290 RepID=UPI00214D1058|nr:MULTISPECIES: glycosyl transferase [unclassified Microbacterium]MCR2801055.1 glycosyl transferase [Microbacterium sp. zg.Y818]WIM23760.1 glycosyl transferase [Microbacterium sp. zg-Y818]
MRFVWAVVAFVLAALMIGAGLAQRTVFQGPTSQSETIEVAEDVPYVLVDGGVLRSQPGSQTLRAQGEGAIFAAYGRTADLEAWLSPWEYAHVALDDGVVASEVVSPAAEPATGDSPEAADAAAGTASTDAAATTVAPMSPAGSDLWLDEFTDEDLLIQTLQLPEDMSVLIAADGSAPAPSRLTITWPIANATPWAGPLIAGGIIVLAIGIVLYILGIRHVRRSRGPRRKGIPMPHTQPIDLSVEEEAKGVVSSSPRRRSLTGKRRGFIAIPAVAMSGLLFAGCSSESWPQFEASPTPTPSATVIAPESQQPPVVTEPQAERILQRVAEQVAAADESLDADVAATRLTGPALAERRTNYTLRGAIPEQKALPPVPAGPLPILLPQAYEGWPRTFMAVVGDEESGNTIMFLSQEDPWSEYKLSYLGGLDATTELPLAPAYVGATQVSPDNAFLAIAPEDLATAYADVLNNGDQSQYAELFDDAADQFRVGVTTDRAARLAAFNETGAQTGSLTFESVAGSQPPVALSTLENGAIVAVTVNENETVKPTTEDAVIKLDGNPTVSTLTGATQSASGFTTTFGDQLFFYVPAKSSTERIQLLGYSSHILDAKVIP